MKLAAAAVAFAFALAAPRVAEACCGFYVSTTDGARTAPAAHVVLMRSGTRTVVTLQPAYDGPTDAFALVLPVPAQVREADVKVVAREVTEAVDRAGAPKLVEYREQDPCFVAPPPAPPAPPAPPPAEATAVEVARFVAGEYQLALLSAKDSAALAAWLRQEKYLVSPETEALLAPHVAAGDRFLVAKVDTAKLSFAEHRAQLSPIRFHYDSDQLALPIRIGLAGSPGTQDLIVSVLAPERRYAAASAPNVVAPTNLDVTAEVAGRFAAFYAALLDRTLDTHRGAWVTEHAGPAALSAAELRALGGDVVEATAFVLTRLHARYAKADAPADLVLVQAPPIAGGRELVTATGRVEEGTQAAAASAFQARYTIRRPWLDALRCDKPRRGVWVASGAAEPALDTAFASRGEVSLAAAVRREVPGLELRVAAPEAAAAPGSAAPATPADPAKKQTGCGCAASGGRDAVGGALLVGACLALRRCRRRTP